MLTSGMCVILVKVAAMGLTPAAHLGRSLGDVAPHLAGLCREYGTHVCGEGGEYETLTLDAPWFTRGRLVLEEWEVGGW